MTFSSPHLSDVSRDSGQEVGLRASMPILPRSPKFHSFSEQCQKLEINVQTYQPEGEINIKQNMGFYYVAQASLDPDSPALAFLVQKSQVRAFF